MEVRVVRVPARILGLAPDRRRKAKIYAADAVPFSVVKIWEGRRAVVRAVAVDHPRETVYTDVWTANALLYRLFASMGGGAVEFHKGYAYAARADGGVLLYFEADGSIFYVSAEAYEPEVYDLGEAANAAKAAERFLGAEKAGAVREFLRAVIPA